MLVGLSDLTPEEEAAVRASAAATFKQVVGAVNPKALAKPAPKAVKKSSTAKPSAAKKKPVSLTVPTGSGGVTTIVATPLSDEQIFGLPKKLVLGVGVAAAAAIAWMMFGRGGGAARTVSNPRRKRPARELSSPNRRVQKALNFRKEFHWGYPAKRVSKRKVAKRPKVLVQLGELASVTYRTNKKGESAQFYKHDFDSRRKPKLCMDVDNKRLHLVGGGYTVTADGITG